VLILFLSAQLLKNHSYLSASTAFPLKYKVAVDATTSSPILLPPGV
jgi:hypothetical protein